jgi:signal transduction histidine kinase/CheY-like chemotaxis protein
MWNELTASEPKRWRLYALIALFPLLGLSAVLLAFPANDPGLPSDEPAEGFYWSASQYQIHFGKLREQLLKIADVAPGGSVGASIDPEGMQELQLRTDILVSRGKLLTEPSATFDWFHSLSDFDRHAAAITDFDRRVSRAVVASEFTAGQAREILKAFDAMDTTVSSLSNAAHQREEEGRSRLFEQYRQRRLYAMVIAALIAAWVAWIFLAYRRNRQLARDRLEALKSERSAKAQLQQSISTKAQFLSMVSHELRSPMQVIVSSVDLLDLGTPAAERRSAVTRIRRAAMMLGVQLRDLLTIARGEAGRFEINPESFEATSLVEDVADVAAHAAREKGLKFSTRVPSEPVFARADVQRISQVLANLVSNAVKYTTAGEVSLALLRPDACTGQLVFVISDTGPGLTPQGVQSLQAPLTRDEELQPGKDGSGVGLSVVRTVMDHLCGRLDIDVKVGEGTCLTVTIPVLFEDPDAVPSDAKSEGMVLVVDDQADISASVAALVERFGHPCHAAQSGAEATTLLAQNTYETAFVDLDLPGISGVELATRIRREPGPNQHAYIVAITAARPHIAHGLFDEILIKPVEGLRVWWNLGHRSRVPKPASESELASPPSAP